MSSQKTCPSPFLSHHRISSVLGKASIIPRLSSQKVFCEEDTARTCVLTNCPCRKYFARMTLLSTRTNVLTESLYCFSVYIKLLEKDGLHCSKIICTRTTPALTRKKERKGKAALSALNYQSRKIINIGHSVSFRGLT